MNLSVLVVAVEVVFAIWTVMIDNDKRTNNNNNNTNVHIAKKKKDKQKGNIVVYEHTRWCTTKRALTRKKAPQRTNINANRERRGGRGLNCSF